MSNSNSQQAYCQTVGTSPTGSAWIDQRDPNGNDVNFKVGQFWVNQNGVRLFYLNSFTSTGGVLQAVWELISVNSILATLSDTGNANIVPASLSSATPPDNIQLAAGAGISVVGNPATNTITITNTGTANTETLTGDDGVPVSPIAGTIQTLGNTVANATFSKALYTNNPNTNIEQFNIQVATTLASTDATLAKVGLAVFSSAQFAVDANGFVTLAGGSTPPTLGITPDAHTGPGTSPVVPDGSGNIKLEGGTTFATGTQANPIRTNSLAANTIDLQIQLAGSNATVSTPNDFGVAQFDSNSFGVASGFVTLKNGGTTGAVTSVQGDDSALVVPASGVITWDGVTVANATNAKPVFFKKNAASTEELDVQLATTSTSAAKNINKSGLCHFDSTDFTIDAATGFVSLSGGASPAIQQITTSDANVVTPSGSPENINIYGTGSITTVGSSPTVTVELTGLTNHAVLVGAGTNTITKIAATANTGAVLQNNSGADPSYSTATYPSTTTINQILYSSAANTVSGLVTGNNGVLITSATGVPSWLADGTTGQVLTATTGAPPSWTTVGGGTVTGLTPDSITGTGTSPVLPNVSGDIIVTGGTGLNYTTGTTSSSIRTVSTATNTLAVEVQLAGANPTSATPNNFGVAQFNSNQFGVSAGYVTSNNFTINTSGSISGGGSITLGGTLNLVGTSTAFPWSDEAVSFNTISNNGYFVTAVAIATLPATPSQGDVIKIQSATASVVTIQANTGQKIRVGNVISAAAGTAKSTKIGDAMELVYRLADTTWYANVSPVGAWGIT